MNLFPFLEAGTSIDVKHRPFACRADRFPGSRQRCNHRHSLVPGLTQAKDREPKPHHRTLPGVLMPSHSRHFRNQLDRLSDRHQECQDDFQLYLDTTCAAHNMLLRDVIVAMKAVESANAGSSVTIQ